jgi:hypothetical protein
VSQFVNPIFVDNELNNLENIEIFDNGIDLPTLEEQEDALLPETNNEVVAVNVSNTFTYGIEEVDRKVFTPYIIRQYNSQPNLFNDVEKNSVLAVRGDADINIRHF